MDDSETRVILSMQSAAETFFEQLKGMPYLEELYFEVARNLVEYLSDTEYGSGNVKEYITESIEMHCCTDLDGYVFNEQLHADAIMRLAQYMFYDMKRHGLYEDTVLWYQVEKFIGYDIVLKSMVKEDFIN